MPGNTDNFLSSSSPGNIFGQSNQSNHGSFSGGFSLFGASPSSTSEGDKNDSDGFTFNFCGIGVGSSPSKENTNSTGFLLF